MRWMLPLLITLSTLNGFEFDLKPQRVTPEVTCFFGEPAAMDKNNNGNMVNTCYIDTKKSYVVIDSGSSYLYADAAFKAMQKIKPLPVELVINTHVHDDHWLGNGYFVQKGVTVLGSDDFVRNASIESPTRIQTHISPEAYLLTVPMRPTQMISEDKTLTIGDQIIELHLMKKKAHSDKDMVVYLPKIKTIFAGDLVFNDRVPSLRDGDINGWISAMEYLDQLNATTIVGGHGFRTDKDTAKLTHDYLIQMRTEVREGIVSGIGLDETIKKVQMPQYQSLKMYDSLHRGNVDAAYRMLEWE
jgi:glyoxylase-like metal-dependent hydrolase (beta-lactamase superfamily II)